ncbi:MAG: deoxyribonuclease IV [Acholeplasmataceae bacterium]|nr:deoxyribonuclease IV [Acholeplasmataceae bacterium]
MLKIGSHVSMSGDDMFLGSVKEAISYNANSFMIYTGAPQNTRRRPIDELKIKEAHELMEEHGLSLDNVVVHAPYIINLGNPDPEKRAFAVNFLTDEVKRTHAMGIKQMVLHPGNATGGNREEAINWIAEGLNEIINNTKGIDVKIALETMAGKGTEVGRTFEEIRQLIDLVQDKDRMGVCFDTCHTSDANYPIKDDFEGVLDEFDKVVGLEWITVMHINDSKNEQGAAKDRHENFGFGHLGFDTLINVIYNPRLKDIPKILETPYVEGKPPYKHEIEMIRNKEFNPDLKEIIANS